jgi:hypothetical protein
MSFTKLDYCQYLLSSPINYTVTNLADHLAGISHDQSNRYLRGEKLTRAPAVGQRETAPTTVRERRLRAVRRYRARQALFGLD